MQYIITFNGEVQYGPASWRDIRAKVGLAGNKIPPRTLPWEHLPDTFLEEYVPPAPVDAESGEQSEANSIRTRLMEIDKASIRSIRAIQAGVNTPEDDAYLAELEAEAATLRASLA